MVAIDGTRATVGTPVIATPAAAPQIQCSSIAQPRPEVRGMPNSLARFKTSPVGSVATGSWYSQKNAELGFARISSAIPSRTLYANGFTAIGMDPPCAAASPLWTDGSSRLGTRSRQSFDHRGSIELRGGNGGVGVDVGQPSLRIGIRALAGVVDRGHHARLDVLLDLGELGLGGQVLAHQESLVA